MTKKQVLWMIILAAVVFTNILESMILMPLSPTIKAELSMDEKQWGLAISVYLFSAFVAGVGSIFIIDRFDRKRFLITQYALFIVGTLLCGLATSYEFLLFARIMAGFFGGVIGAIVMSIVGDLIQPEHRGKATGIVMAGFSSAAGLGIPLGLWLGHSWNWHMPFFFLVGLSLIAWVLLILYLPNVNKHLDGSGHKSYMILKTVWKNSNQIKGLLFTSTILFGQFAIIPYLADYMVHNVGLKENQLVWMYFFGGILTFITNPYIGYLADKFGQLRVFLIIMSISLVPLAIITNMGVNPLPVILIVTTAFFIFAGGRNIPGTAIVMGTAAPHERGGYMSIRSAFQQFASGFAVILGSWLTTQQEDGSYLHFEYVGYLAIGTSILSYFLLKTIKQQF
ncbi:MAG: MFS transporter [Fluviicola sp.]|nr:MFS transporter [Fluviicola sp.]